jgi:predicted ATPase
MLTAFGVESGLFHGVAVNRFGGRPSAPFELRVGLATKTINLADVGYGVSQVLPLLVEASTAPRGRYLLLQQPEIHLHPRAQAALGTLFAQLAAENHCRLMVETHSDYLMDRIRQEIAAGKIAPELVALLYLHREGLESKCHLIEMDNLGNLINPPDDYRTFFLEEGWRLLRRGAQH